jgi:hypothetical protein
MGRTPSLTNAISMDAPRLCKFAKKLASQSDWICKKGLGHISPDCALAFAVSGTGLSFGEFLAPSSRADPNELAESAVECCLIQKTRLYRDVVEGGLRRQHELLGSLDSPHKEPAMGGDAEASLE